MIPPLLAHYFPQGIYGVGLPDNSRPSERALRNLRPDDGRPHTNLYRRRLAYGPPVGLGQAADSKPVPRNYELQRNGWSKNV